MKKLIAVMLVVFVALGVAVPVMATPVDELTELAQYFPADTDMFITIRTDDAYFETLDGILSAVGEQVPGMIPPELNMEALLAEISSSITPDGDTNFEEDIRPWLGGSAAFVFTDFVGVMEAGSDEDVPAFIALSVADQDAAESFLDEITVDGFGGYEYEKTERADGILYTPDSDFWTSFLLTDGVLLLRPTNQDASTLTVATGDTLAESETFTGALGNLPEDDYNLLVYTDIADIYGELSQDMQSDALLPFFTPEEFGNLMSAFGAQAIGFTLLDDKSLVMDVAQPFDPATYEEIGFPVMYGDAIDTGFAANVPADAPLVIHATNFGPAMLMQLEAFETLAMTLQEAFPDATINDEEYAFYLLDDVLAFTRLAYQGLSGQSFEEALGWMTGDYATFLRASANENGLVVDGAIVVANTDDAAASAFLDGMRNLLYDLTLDYTDEDDVLTVPYIRELLEVALQGEGQTVVDNLDLVIGKNDDAVVIGNGDAANEVLAGLDESLADTDAFANAAPYLLDGSQSLAYIDTTPLVDLLNVLATGFDEELEQVATLVNIIESSTISASADEGLSVVRMVITLR